MELEHENRRRVARRTGWRRFGAEAALTLATGAGFVAVGVAWAGGTALLRGQRAPAVSIYGDWAVSAADAPAARLELDSSPIAAREATAPIAYDRAAMAAREPRIWLVDGYNVLHAGVLGGRDRALWWTEARRRELVERVAGFAQDAEVWIVFDGADERGSEADPPGPRCVFAASADDWLVERVRSAEDPSAIAVVTGDRQVAERSRGSGARVVSPKEFLERCAT